MNLLIHPPKLIRRAFPRYIWKINETEKVLYLTFDDGPIPELTPWVINTLEKYNAKATFFCVGHNVFKYPDIYDMVLKNGHATGNHTYSHLNGWKNTNEALFSDIEKADKLIKSILFRPPYGKLTNSQMRFIARHKQIVLWDVLTRDYDKTVSPEICYSYVEKFAKPGSIIVFHDNIKATKNMQYALEKTLVNFSAKGYTFKALKTVPD